MKSVQVPIYRAIFTTIGLWILFINISYAQTKRIETTKPGEIRSLLSAEAQSIKKLIVKGSLDDRDIKFLSTSMPNLQDLDLYDTEIKKLEIGDKVFSEASISKERFKLNKSLVNIILPKSLKTIEQAAFQSCRKLETVHIEGPLNKMGYHAFSDCPNLKEVIMNDTNLSLLPQFAFANCEKLVKIDLPVSIEIIDNDALYGCRSLTELTLHKNVSDIRESVFVGCKSLKKLVVESAVPPFVMNVSTFGNIVNTAILYVPDKEISSYRRDASWSAFKVIKSISELTQTEIVSQLNTMQIVNESGFYHIKLDRPERYAVFSMNGAIVKSGNSQNIIIEVREPLILNVNKRIIKLYNQ